VFGTACHCSSEGIRRVRTVCKLHDRFHIVWDPTVAVSQDASALSRVSDAKSFCMMLHIKREGWPMAR